MNRDNNSIEVYSAVITAGCLFCLLQVSAGYYCHQGAG